MEILSNSWAVQFCGSLKMWRKKCAIKYISEEIKQKERKYDKINENLENRWDQSEGGIWWYKWKKQWLKKMWEHGKESIYRNKCEIIKRWQDQIRWDQLIKYKMINWREQKSDEVKYKMIKERERTKMRSSGRSGVCNNKCQDCKLCCNLSLGGASFRGINISSAKSH